MINIKDFRIRRILHWSLLGGTALATIGLYVTTTGCRFMSFGPENSSNSDDFIGFGFFKIAIYGNGSYRGCLPYLSSFEEESFNDAAVGAGRAFAVMALILILILLIILSLLILHVQFPGKMMIAWRVVRALFIVVMTFNYLSFTIMATNVCDTSIGGTSAICKVGGAGIIAILNGFLLVGLSVISFLIPPPAYPVFQLRGDTAAVPDEADAMQKNTEEDKAQSVDVSGNVAGPIGDEAPDEDHTAEVVPIADVPNDDGSLVSEMTEFGNGQKKITREVTHQDGSKTITVIVEEM